MRKISSTTIEAAAFAAPIANLEIKLLRR